MSNSLTVLSESSLSPNSPKKWILSYRNALAFLRWAERSGVFCNKTYSWKHCNDKPDLQTGLPLLDDFSVTCAKSMAFRRLLALKGGEEASDLGREAQFHRRNLQLCS